MTTDHANHEQQLLDFVRERHPPEVQAGIDSATDLFENGVLDSIGFVGLSVLVEDLAGKPIDFGQIKASELRSIRDILRLCF